MTAKGVILLRASVCSNHVRSKHLTVAYDAGRMAAL